MPPTFLVLLLALASAALAPLVLAALLIAMLFPRSRRAAGRILALALPAGGLAGAVVAGLCRLAGLDGEGLFGPGDVPLVAACATFSTWAAVHAGCRLWLRWRQRGAPASPVGSGSVQPPIPGAETNIW